MDFLKMDWDRHWVESRDAIVSKNLLYMCSISDKSTSPLIIIWCKSKLNKGTLYQYINDAEDREDT